MTAKKDYTIYKKDLRFRFISLDEAVSIIKQLDPVFDYDLFGVCIVDATRVGVSTVLGQDYITEYLYQEKTNDFFGPTGEYGYRVSKSTWLGDKIVHLYIGKQAYQRVFGTFELKDGLPYEWRNKYRPHPEYTLVKSLELAAKLILALDRKGHYAVSEPKRQDQTALSTEAK